MRAKQVQLGEVEYAYSEGPGNGPMLVLMHGLSGNRHSWDPVLPYLIDHYKLYLVDHRGHGFSTHLPGHYHVDVITEDAARFIKEVVGESAFVLGHSMGARVALHLAARHGDLTKKIVLEDPPLGYGPSLEAIRSTFKYWLELTRKHLSEEDLMQKLATYNDSEDLEEFRYKAQTLRQMDPEVLEVALGGGLWAGTVLSDVFAQVRCPAILFQADTGCGGIIDEDLSEFAGLQRPNWSWKRFAGAGHSIHHEMPETFAGDVRSFLQATLS